MGEEGVKKEHTSIGDQVMRRIMKFGTVGIFNTLITFISYTILLSVGLHYIAANVIAYSLGVLNSYYWNKNWVFQADNGQKGLFIKFIIVNLITLCLNTYSLYLLVDYLKLHPVFSQVIAIGVGMIVNYVLNQKWTFNIKDTGGN